MMRVRIHIPGSRLRRIPGIHIPGSRLRRIPGILTLVLALAAARSVAAQDVSLKAKADAEMDALQYTDALAHYEQAYELTHDPALLYNQGRALQALGRYPDALGRLERFRTDASPELRAKVPKLDALIDDVRNHVAKITVSCAVAGAHVFLRGVELGVTPLSGVSVNAGKAKIDVTADGYAPWSKSVELPGAGALVMDAVLVAKNSQSILAVHSNVAGAEAWIDDRFVGVVPVESTVKPGEHRVSLRREGYDPNNTTAIVAEGSRKQLDLDLTKQAGLTSKWWFWTGVGVVVLAGGVVTYALLTEKRGGSGDLPPGQTAGPLTLEF